MQTQSVDTAILVRRSLGLLAVVLASACGGQTLSAGTDSAGSSAAAATEPSPPAEPPPSAAPMSNGTSGAQAPSPPATRAQPYPWVASCPQPPVESWVPAARPTGSIDDFHAYAAAARAMVVGRWRGQGTPWGAARPVAFSFASTGHYMAMCLQADCTALGYLEMGAEYDRKQYRLDTMSFDGVMSGTIDLAFGPYPAMGEDPNNAPWIPSTGTTVLQGVELDASGNRLRFDFVSHMQSPPMKAHYELWRCP